MKEVERSLKALANKRRLGIIKYLRLHHQAPVGGLADAIKLSFRSTSKHLGVLKAADIVEAEQKSKLVFYSLSKIQPPIVRAVINHL